LGIRQARGIAKSACVTPFFGVIMFRVTSGLDKTYNMLDDTRQAEQYANAVN
jgi:hypothetical protein